MFDFPNIEPASDGSLESFARTVLTSWLRNEVSSCLPATIVSYDRVKNVAIVAPAIAMVTTEGQVIPRPALTVPVFNYGGGGFVINFDLKAGDTGWIKASDRDISLFLQNKSRAKPNTGRMWTFEDAIFYPDIINGGQFVDGLCIQSTGGAVRINLTNDKIELTKGSKKITLTNSGIEIIGNVTINGTITATGAVTAADLNAGGKTFLGHKNGGQPVD